MGNFVGDDALIVPQDSAPNELVRKYTNDLGVPIDLVRKNTNELCTIPQMIWVPAPLVCRGRCPHRPAGFRTK